METKQIKQLTIAKSDHDILMHYIRTNSMDLKYDRVQAEQLVEEIKDARIVNNSEFPKDVVRLNSKVVIRNTVARQNYGYRIVLPNEADHKNEKVSVLAPMGSALLGVAKGDTVSLPSARGKQHFIVLEVSNPID